MESQILEKLKEAIHLADNKFNNDDKTKEFEIASKEFEELVKQGVAKKRGYNLLTITESHLHRVSFNMENKSGNSELLFVSNI